MITHFWGEKDFKSYWSNFAEELPLVSFKTYQKIKCCCCGNALQGESFHQAKDNFHLFKNAYPFSYIATN
jgi:hypothetical protein